MGDGQHKSYFKSDDIGNFFYSSGSNMGKAASCTNVSDIHSLLKDDSIFEGIKVYLKESKFYLDATSVSSTAKTFSIFNVAFEYLVSALRVLDDDLYSIKDKCVALLRVLSVNCELTNLEGPDSFITRTRETLLGLMISMTNLITHQPLYNTMSSNKCGPSQLEKQTMQEIKVLTEELSSLIASRKKSTVLQMEPGVTVTNEDYNDFESFKYDNSFMTSSANIYFAKKIYDFYELISNTKNNTTTGVANDSLEQTQKFISNGCSKLPIHCQNGGSSGLTYEDFYANDNTLIIKDGTKNKEVTITPGLTEEVAIACKSIKQYSQDSGRNICNLPLNLRSEDEFIKCFINYGKYCELYNYFRDDCKRLIFEGYLQIVMYSMLMVDEGLCNHENNSSGENVHQMLKQIFSFGDLKDEGTKVEQRYANYAVKYINVYKESLQNHISKLRSHLEKKHSNSDQGHKILNISKTDYEEAKVCEDLELFIAEFAEGADFEVRKMAPENFNISVNNKVYVASILLQYAVMENDSGMNMNMVQKLLRLKADPRVENLRDGMSAVGIALLYENSVEKFLREFTTRRRHLTENKSDVNKCLISSDLRIIEDYSNQEIILDLLKHLYYFT